jgi:F0F1-type ATP synthase assembly protein I
MGAWPLFLDKIVAFYPGDHMASTTLLLVALAACFCATVLTIAGERRGRRLLVIGLLAIVAALLNVLWADDVWNLGLGSGMLSFVLPLSWLVFLLLLARPRGVPGRSRRAALLVSATFFIVLSAVAFLEGIPQAESESDEDRLGALHSTVLFFETRVGVFAGQCFLLFLFLAIASEWREEGRHPDRWRIPMGLFVFSIALMIATGLRLESYYRNFIPAYPTPYAGFAVLLAGGTLMCLSLLYSFLGGHGQRSTSRWGGIMLISLAVSSVGIGLVLLDDVARAQDPISTSPLPRWVAPYSIIMEGSAASFFGVGILLLLLGRKLWDRLSLVWGRPPSQLAPMILLLSLPAILFVSSLFIHQISEVAMRSRWGFEVWPEAWLFSPAAARILWRAGLRWAGVVVAGVLGILSILLMIPIVSRMNAR